MEWRYIKGAEIDAQVSDSGDIKVNGKIKKRTGKDNNEYIRVKIKGVKERYVHRIVADAFCEKKAGQNQVNHKNGNKRDNRAENLEWVTARENTLLAVRNGLLKTHNISKNSYVAMDIETGNSYLFNTQRELGEYIKVPEKSVQKALKRKGRKTTGYGKYIVGKIVYNNMSV